MKDVDTANGIIPLGEFKSNASRLLKRLQEIDGPMVVTQNGRPAAVVLSPRAFERMRERQAYLEAVATGLADAESGRMIEHAEVAGWLKSWGREGELEPPECE